MDIVSTGTLLPECLRCWCRSSLNPLIGANQVHILCCATLYTGACRQPHKTVSVGLLLQANVRHLIPRYGFIVGYADLRDFPCRPPVQRRFVPAGQSRLFRGRSSKRFLRMPCSFRAGNGENCRLPLSCMPNCANKETRGWWWYPIRYRNDVWQTASNSMPS